MDRRALLISTLVTLSGVGLMRLYMHRFEQAVAGGAPTEVLVLTKDTPAGTALTRDRVGSRALPEAYLESRHIAARDLDQVLDAKLGLPVRANETLLWSDLASFREPTRQLSSLVPEGMRAFTLETNANSFNPLLVPGDRVDVLLIGPSRANRDTDASAIVAQNLLVLAIGDQLSGATERGRNANQITLSVTPEIGARLARAEQRGALRLVVRNPDDVTVSEIAEPGIAINKAED